LIELLAVLAVTTLLAMTLAAGMARTKPAGQSLRCLNNLRELTRAWSMYAVEHNDRVVNNFGVTEQASEITSGRFGNWINNIMVWTAGSEVFSQSVTNGAWVSKGPLGSYTAGQVGPFKCSSDAYLSPMQVRAGFKQRNRSYSMSAMFGRFSNGIDETLYGRNWGMPQFRQYLRTSQVPKPAKTWLFVEEHADSINDGYFINSDFNTAWADIPASYHNGACGFAFSDGHAELRQWLSVTSKYPVRFNYPNTRNFDALGRDDFNWMRERTGYIDFNTGLPKHGY
jgi:hypothetical protein